MILAVANGIFKLQSLGTVLPCFLIAMSLAAFVDIVLPDSAYAKATVKRAKARRFYLVPPPPPVVLPSSWKLMKAHYPEQVPDKPKNPYKKYVFAKEGYEDPVPVKVNKHVTYWNLQ